MAASLGAVGMGSDTCGSIRIPSAFNNLVGLRPSRGLSSIHGVMRLSHTQDTADPLARNTGHAIESGYPQRRTPVVTPDLVDGAPPPMRIGAVAIGDEDGFGINGDVRFDPSLNLLEWDLQISEDGPLRTQALGLVFGEPSAPMAVSLIGPELLDRPRGMESGSIFLSPQLRAALENDPVFLKAFGGKFPQTGAAWPFSFEANL